MVFELAGGGGNIYPLPVPRFRQLVKNMALVYRD